MVPIAPGRASRRKSRSRASAMKRKDALAAYQDFSARTSDRVRQLAFAGLGVVWIFKSASGFGFPRLLLWAGVLLVAALSFDFLQQLYGAIAWGTLNRMKERAKVGPDSDFLAPKQINWPTNVFFAAKVLTLCTAYALILSQLIGIIGTGHGDGG